MVFATGMLTVAAAVAAAGGGGVAVTPAEPAATDHATLSELAFPIGDDMPEGRWASACSLTCILPGVNATRTVLDESFEIGADVCVAHVEQAAATMGPGNATQLAESEIQQALSTMQRERRRKANRWPDPVVKYESHASQEAAQPHCPTGSRLVDGRSWWPTHPNLLSVAKDDAAHEHRELVADEVMVFGALSMGRNVLGGSVHRHVGAYDVVAVSVQRLGVCADHWCDSVVAVDTTRPSMPVTNCTNAAEVELGGGTERDSSNPLTGCSTTNVPIITHVGPDGVERPVHMASSELLSLGRGMLGSPKWFERAATPFHLGGQLLLEGPALLVPSESKKGLLSIQDGLQMTQWDLNGTVFGNPVPNTSDTLLASPTSTPFLAHLATILCAGRLRSFLASSSACEGIRPWGRVRRASGYSEIHGNIMDADVWTGAGSMKWTVKPTSLTAVAVDNASASHTAMPYMRPAWTSEEIPGDTVLALGGFRTAPVQVTPAELLGRPSREVNPSSASETKLAASLFQRQLVLPATAVSGHDHVPFSKLDMDAAEAVSDLEDPSDAGIELSRELNRISHAYDRRVFQEEHPAAPVSSADLVLAIIMVIPELGALLVLLLTTERWGRAALLGFSTIALLGAVSLSGVIALASQEAVGAAWRARSTRTAIQAVFPAGNPVDEEGMPTSAGTLVVIEKSFLLLAPTTYQPAQVQQVAAAVCGVYIVAAAVMAARVLFLARQQRRASRVYAQAPASVTVEAPRRPQRWWRTCARDSSRGTADVDGIEDDSGGDGDMASAGTWRGSGIGAAVFGSRTPPWPLFAGKVPWPPRSSCDGWW